MKRAVVTGGTRGIGLAICRLLSERGYAVTATYARSEEDARRAREALPAVKFVRADAAEEADAAALFAEGVDLLVCNAGIDLFKQIQDVSAEEYARVMNVNFGGVFFACKHAVKKMLAAGGGGAIVTVSSVWGEVGGSCESIYSASKGAVIAFTKALAKELAPSGIRVNCIAPGAVDTAMNARLDEDERRTLCEEIPLGRFATAEEVAEAALLLAEHPYLTGTVLNVNGGWN